jgi:TRAP-type C4-dicarboxylate transport system substrate-binding protein
MKAETSHKRFAGLIEELQTEIKSAMTHQERGEWGAVADTMQSASTTCKRMASTAEKLAQGGS